MLAEEMTDAPTGRRAPRRWRPLDLPSALGLGIGAAAFGLLPWLVTGLRLPLQNLWATAATPGAMPRVLLPFSQYTVAFIVAALSIGALTAGLVARLLRSRTPRGWWWLAAGMVAVAQSAALVQTATTVYAGLPKIQVAVFRDGRPELRTELAGAARPYFDGIVVGAALAIVLGFALLVLIARSPAPGFVIAVGFAAVALGVWLDFLVNPITRPPLSATTALLGVARWVPAVVLGLALAWVGFRTVARVVGAIVALAALWIGPALIDAVTGALGSRALLGRPDALVDYALLVFRAELIGHLGTWADALVALAIGAAGVIVLNRTALRSRA